MGSLNRISICIHLILFCFQALASAASLECKTDKMFGTTLMSGPDFFCPSGSDKENILLSKDDQRINSVTVKVNVKSAWPFGKGHDELVTIPNLPNSLSQLKNYKNKDFWNHPFMTDAIAKKIKSGSYVPVGIESFSFSDPIIMMKYISPGNSVPYEPNKPDDKSVNQNLDGPAVTK